jgi:serine protease Do
VVIGLTGVVSAGQNERKTAVVQAIQKVQPSVVSISSEKRSASTSRWPFTTEETQRPRVSGMGTGVIIDHRGFILTNQHVVDKVQGIEVQLGDGSVYQARLVQQDPNLDVAIIKIDAGRNLVPVRIGTSTDLMVGETVITIGNAFGYENTTSVGIVSALGRNVTLSDDQVYRNLIQTDACINPGNSGGPLVNIEGELIGINVAVRAGAQGIGFALPIDDVKRVTTEMMSTKRLVATWHGIVSTDSVSAAGRTVVVTDVPAGSPAELSGIRKGDQIVKVNQLDVVTSLDVERGLLDVRAGQRVGLIVRRANDELELEIEPRPISQATLASATVPDSAADQIWKRIGLKMVPVSREYVKLVSPSFRGGLYVQAVLPGSPAARASIQKGDILVGMNASNRDWETIRPDNVLFILNQPDVSQAQAIQYYLVRRNEFVQGLLSLGEAAVSNLRR